MATAGERGFQSLAGHGSGGRRTPSPGRPGRSSLPRAGASGAGLGEAWRSAVRLLRTALLFSLKCPYLCLGFVALPR